MSWSGMENLHRSRWFTELCQPKIRCIGRGRVIGCSTYLQLVPKLSYDDCLISIITFTCLTPRRNCAVFKNACTATLKRSARTRLRAFLFFSNGSGLMRINRIK